MAFRIGLFLLTVTVVHVLPQSLIGCQTDPLVREARLALSIKPQLDALKKLKPLIEKNDARAVELLVYQLPRHLNPIIRGHLARELQHVGDDLWNSRTPGKPKRVVDALTIALDDSVVYQDPTEPISEGEGVINAGWSVQAEAARSLGILNTPTKENIQKLIQLARIKDPARLRARLEAIRTLGKFGPRAAKAAPVISAVLKAKEKQHFQLRRAAVKSLGQLGAEAATEIPVLLEQLGGDYDDKNSLVYAIAGMKDGAKDVIPLFFSRIFDGSGLHYTSALAHMGNVVHPFLEEQIQSDNARNRKAALHVLRHIGKEASFAVSDVKTMLDDPDAEIRQLVVALLINMEERAAPAQAELESVLANEENALRDQAMIGLFVINPRHPQALKHLEQIAQSPKNLDVAAWAIRIIKENGELVAPIVARDFANYDKWQRVKAAQILLFINPASETGLQMMRESLGSSDRDIQSSAISRSGGLGENGKALLDSLKGLRGLDGVNQKFLEKNIARIESAIAVN